MNVSKCILIKTMSVDGDGNVVRDDGTWTSLAHTSDESELTMALSNVVQYRSGECSPDAAGLRCEAGATITVAQDTYSRRAPDRVQHIVSNGEGGLVIKCEHAIGEAVTA